MRARRITLIISQRNNLADFRNLKHTVLLIRKKADE